MKIWFSKKIHPCDVCENAPETIALCQKLVEEYEKAQTAENRDEIYERMQPVIAKMEALDHHYQKYETLRKALVDMENNLWRDPGVVIVYEDFASRYQADGSKMMDLILTLVYWDPVKKKKVIK